MAFAVAIVFPLHAAAGPPEGTNPGKPAPEALPRTEPDTAIARPWTVRVEGGLGAPAGFVGATVGYAPIQYLSIEYSTGWGFTGWQHGVMLRPRVPVTASSTLSIGAGASLGWLPAKHEVNYDAPAVTSFWLHTEFSYELRTDVGPSLLVGLGGVYYAGRIPERPAHQGWLDFWWDITDESGTHWGPAARVGLGWAF